MPSPILRLLPPFCTILTRRARPLFPMDEYVIAALTALVVPEEIPAPDTILPAVLVLHNTAPHSLFTCFPAVGTSNPFLQRPPGFSG